MRDFLRKYLVFAILGIVLIGVIVYSIMLSSERDYYKNELSGFYAKSFDTLYMDVGSLDSKLLKLKASESASMHTNILMDIWRQAGDAETAIASLPVAYAQTQGFSQYINRLGDYCRMLAVKTSRGEKIKDEEYKQIDSLIAKCEQLKAELDSVWENGYIANLSFSQEDFYTPQGSQTEDNTATLDFQSQEYPQLVYDGPFSQSTENKQPQGLGDLIITAEQAEKIARDFIGASKLGSMHRREDETGTIECYVFGGNCAYGDYAIQVVKKGGAVLNFIVETANTASAVPSDERYAGLAARAVRFLDKQGLGEFAPSYAQYYGGCAVINLAPLENGVVLYPDLIKVWIDIDSDNIYGYDAFNYLMSHTKRELPLAKLTTMEARQSVSKRVMVENSRLALIPNDNNQELLCFEFASKIGEQDFLIYVNALNGAEEKVLMVVHTNEGTLTM